ncbi:hypothetical protein B0H15DRAFT_957023 [Mycena belliarum]|uniref:Uncharacterized protein n=1 Tax=Mycena belliarum TaxID=1033014 RepID=A0AAD6TQP1_9AGAR|nr:hypothetical protein B0H15DRAFT_957023 [Mycena belliae]
MFRQLSNQLAVTAKGTEAPKAIAPTLRSDIYTAIDQTKSWIVGGMGQAGDGMSYGSALATIQKHFPDVKMGVENLASAENEVSVVVCGVTNMILEMSRWEGMAGGMAMRTWADALVEVHGRLPAGSRKDGIARGVARGISQNTEVSLMTKEFTARIQIISSLKSVCTRVYGAGTAEARQAEAVLSSRLI